MTAVGSRKPSDTVDARPRVVLGAAPDFRLHPMGRDVPASGRRGTPCGHDRFGPLNSGAPFGTGCSGFRFAPSG